MSKVGSLQSSTKVKSEWFELVMSACCRLKEAVDAMLEKTIPSTPRPRPRVFCFAPEVRWPDVGRSGVAWTSVVVGSGDDSLGYSVDSRYLVEEILKQCRWQPRLILRAIRRIEAATQWCGTRRAGRERSAREILRQQSGAVEALEAMAAVKALAG